MPTAQLCSLASSDVSPLKNGIQKRRYQKPEHTYVKDLDYMDSDMWEEGRLEHKIKKCIFFKVEIIKCTCIVFLTQLGWFFFHFVICI